MVCCVEGKDVTFGHAQLVRYELPIGSSGLSDSQCAV